MATVALRTFRDHGSGHTGTEVVPAGVLLVIGFGEAYRVGIGDGPLTDHHHGFVVGAQSRYGRSALTGVAEGVQVDLSWSAASTILGPGLVDLADLAVGLPDLPGGADLADRLPEVDESERVRLVGDWLRLHSRAHEPPAPLLTRALTAIEDGAPSVGLLAERLGCSRGHLHRVVRGATGQSPSTLIRITRLYRLLDLGRRSTPRPSLARAAAAVGYADHAHLCHEARTLAGRSPTDLLIRAELPGRAVPVT